MSASILFNKEEAYEFDTIGKNEENKQDTTNIRLTNSILS
jgi:hypothetical protein